MENSPEFIEAFKVFKQGVTSQWVTILIPNVVFSNELQNKKISFYKSLGYSISTL